MNAWIVVACVLLPCGAGPCVWRASRGEPGQRLAGTALLAVVAEAVFLLAARGLHRTSYVDVALVLAVLAPAGTLVFARCLSGVGGRPRSEERS
ncbi:MULTISPECIES: monovalent cation/H+ antiporter complex subunit F [unclassified Streptomyces]|uniref:monovalent cation/H+ antiporter complex subunit F n=1 Tax=unclassified Streptomyces TaxID=2593676 RepID=UPI002E29B4BC|nr:monovalent cation/H+ antiporter complex subunit F [Streptomyces sp. NBC_00223]